MNLNERMDAATLRAERAIPQAVLEWDGTTTIVSLCVTVWTAHDGDVENKLVDLLRKAADAMEVSRQ